MQICLFNYLIIVIINIKNYWIWTIIWSKIHIYFFSKNAKRLKFLVINVASFFMYSSFRLLYHSFLQFFLQKWYFYNTYTSAKHPMYFHSKNTRKTIPSWHWSFDWWWQSDKCSTSVRTDVLFDHVSHFFVNRLLLFLFRIFRRLIFWFSLTTCWSK